MVVDFDLTKFGKELKRLARKKEEEKKRVLAKAKVKARSSWRTVTLCFARVLILFFGIASITCIFTVDYESITGRLQPLRCRYFNCESGKESKPPGFNNQVGNVENTTIAQDLRDYNHRTKELWSNINNDSFAMKLEELRLDVEDIMVKFKVMPEFEAS